MAFDVEAWVRPNIRALKPYSSARHEYEGEAEVFLDANENPFNNGLNRYPDPLQEAVKEKLSVLKGVPVSRIFLGNGSDEAIDLIVRMFCEPRRDAIMILPPTYGMYQVSADIADVKVQQALLTPEFDIDFEAVIAALTPDTRVIFICSPNNPTGNQIPLLHVSVLAEGFRGIVVVDEAYIDFAPEESATTLLDKYPNVIVLQTFSKAWGLAGIRLGMAFASPEIIAYFNKVKPPYNVNQLTQEAALKALDNRQQQLEQVELLLRERETLRAQLATLPYVKQVYPSHANFVLAVMDDANAVYRYLVQEKIIVRNRSNVVLCDSSLRITVGTPQENQRLLEMLVNYKNKP